MSKSRRFLKRAWPPLMAWYVRWLGTENARLRRKLRRDAYPRIDGGFLVIGPQCFTYANDHSVISFRGVNYVRQMDRMDYVEVVARWLAKQDENFVSAAEWAGAVGVSYREVAEDLIRVLSDYEAGRRSGGL